MVKALMTPAAVKEEPLDADLAEDGEEEAEAIDEELHAHHSA